VSAIITLRFCVAWVACGTATYKFIQHDEGDSRFANFVGAFVFWPIVLPLIMGVIGYRSGEAFYRDWAQRRMDRARPLRAGTENGLYD
jgi:cytochrome b